MLKERTASFYIGEDQWHCTTYAISEIGKIESKSQYLIRRAYDAWAALCENGLPQVGRFDPTALLHADEAGRISRIDTGKEPSQFELLTVGPGERHARPLNPENPFHRHGVLMEVLECKETRQPIFQEVKLTIDGKERHKLRLLLPFADDAGDVATVYTACCLITGTVKKPVDFTAIIP